MTTGSTARRSTRTSGASCRGLTDKTLRLWDAATGKQIGPAMKHDDAVNGAVVRQGRAAHPVVV